MKLPYFPCFVLQIQAQVTVSSFWSYGCCKLSSLKGMGPMEHLVGATALTCSAIYHTFFWAWNSWVWSILTKPDSVSWVPMWCLGWIFTLFWVPHHTPPEVCTLWSQDFFISDYWWILNYLFKHLGYYLILVPMSFVSPECNLFILSVNFELFMMPYIFWNKII